MSLIADDNQPMCLTLAAGQKYSGLVVDRRGLASTPELMTGYRGVQLVLVSDSHLAPLYSFPLRDSLVQSCYKAHVLVIPAGEEGKIVDTLYYLDGECVGLEVERDDIVLAVGRGIVGIVAGMLGSTYLRGSRLIQVPTSLVAMVTAGIDSKVGVNYRGYKNLIGLFKHPKMALTDLDTLVTIPDIEFRSGLGELVTVGVLRTSEIFERLESGNATPLGLSITAVIQRKSVIVNADTYDLLGLRALLNLGHTFAHALEKLSNFSLPHGLAVAVGLHLASRLFAALGLCMESLTDLLQHVLTSLGLPTALTGYISEETTGVKRSDKKLTAGQLHLELPIAHGHVEELDEEKVSLSPLKEVLRKWL